MRSSVSHLRTSPEAPPSSPASRLSHRPSAVPFSPQPSAQGVCPSGACLGGTGRCRLFRGVMARRLSAAIRSQERRLTVIQVEEGKPAPGEEGPPLGHREALHLHVLLDCLLDGGVLTVQPVPAPQAAVQTRVHLETETPVAPWCRPSYGALLVTHVAIHRPRAWTLLWAVAPPWTHSGLPPPPTCAWSPLAWQARGANRLLEGRVRGLSHACVHARPPQHGSSSAAPATALSRSGQPSLVWKTGRDSGVSDSPQPSGRGDTLQHCCPLGASACGLLSPARCGNLTRSQGLWQRHSTPGARRDRTLRNGQHRPLVRSYFPYRNLNSVNNPKCSWQLSTKCV